MDKKQKADNLAHLVIQKQQEYADEVRDKQLAEDKLARRKIDQPREFDLKRAAIFADSIMIELFQSLRDNKVVVESWNDPLYEQLEKPEYITERGFLGIKFRKANPNGYIRAKGKKLLNYSPAIVEVNDYCVTIMFNYVSQVTAGVDSKGNYYIHGGYSEGNYLSLLNPYILGSIEQPLNESLLVEILGDILNNPGPFAGNRKVHWGYVCTIQDYGPWDMAATYDKYGM